MPSSCSSARLAILVRSAWVLLSCGALVAPVAAFRATPGCERARSLAAAPAQLRCEAHQRGQRLGSLRGGSAAARMAGEVTLYTNKMCPFAQKAWIALEEKKAAHGVPFAMEEIGLYGAGGKPGWFLKVTDALSPKPGNRTNGLAAIVRRTRAPACAHAVARTHACPGAHPKSHILNKPQTLNPQPQPR